MQLSVRSFPDELPEALYRSLVTPLRDAVTLECNYGAFDLTAQVEVGMLMMISESMDGHARWTKAGGRLREIELKSSDRNKKAIDFA